MWGPARARREPGEAGTRSDGRSGGVLVVLAGSAQLTPAAAPEREARGARWWLGGRPPGQPLTCARCSTRAAGARVRAPLPRAAAAQATGAARGLWGEEQWVPPLGPPRAPRPARPLPPSRLGSGAQGHRSPGLGIFQAAEVQRTELGAPPRPAPQGPSARPSRPGWGPGPGGTRLQAGIGDAAERGEDIVGSERKGEEVLEEGFWKLIVNPFSPLPSHTHRYTPLPQPTYTQTP